MRFFSLIILSAVDLCFAKGNWRIEGDVRGWEYVQPAIQDAIEVAQTASRVLKENYNDPEVQKLIKMVFGGRDTDAKAREAQKYLDGVAQYKNDPKTDLALQGTGIDTSDCIFHVQNPWIEVAGGGMMHKVTGTRYTTAKEVEKIKLCWGETGSGRARAASTLVPRIFNQAGYDAAVSRNENPKKEDFWVEQNTHLAHIDLCLWYLDQAGEVLVDKQMPTLRSYIEHLKANPPADNLSMDLLTETLQGTIIHELSHTILGGLTDDIPKDNCYGWRCVRNAREPRNADSINVLALVMYIWDMGYTVGFRGELKDRV